MLRFKLSLRRKFGIAWISIMMLGAHARATPQILGINGSVYDNAGNAVNAGPHAISVNVYNAASGGSLLWNSSGYSVTPTAGRFDFDLDTTLGGVSSLTSSLSTQSNTAATWYELVYDGNTVRPRSRARGTVFALSSSNADTLRGVTVSTLAPVSGNVLGYNGSIWVSTSVSTAGIAAVLRAGDSMSGALASNSALNVSNLVTAATVNVSTLTPNRLVWTDGSSNLVSSAYAVSDAQLAYLGSVSANVQTQLNAKAGALASAPLTSGSAGLSVSGSGLVFGSAPTLSIATASSTSSGIVTSADWTNFYTMGSVTTWVARSGDTMTGALSAATLSAVSANVGDLTPNSLVRADATGHLISVTAAVTDYALAGLADVTAAIEPQIASKVAAYSIHAIGTIVPYGGSRSANTTNGSTMVTGLIGTATLAPGQQVAGPGIPSGTLIVSVTGPTSIQISAAATATASGVILVIPPLGYLLCDGSSISRATYASLYENLESSWGAGDGSTTFNLPDLRGKFLRGQDWSQGRDPDAAARTAPRAGANSADAVGSSQSSQFSLHSHGITDAGHTHALIDPGHSHTFYDPGHTHYYLEAYNVGSYYFAHSGLTVFYATAGGSWAAATGVSLGAATTGITMAGITTGVTLQNSGSSDTRPANNSVNYIIKY